MGGDENCAAKTLQDARQIYPGLPGHGDVTDVIKAPQSGPCSHANVAGIRRHGDRLPVAGSYVVVDINVTSSRLKGHRAGG